MKMLWIVFAILLFSGCLGPPLAFEKPGATAYDFAIDQHDCKIRGNQAAGNHAFALDPVDNLYYVAPSRQDLIKCLNRRGWEVVGL